MSTLVLSGEAFTHIMKVCGAIIDTKNSREYFRYIYLKVEGEQVTAYGTNGYAVAYTKENLLEVPEEPCEILIPVTKAQKGVASVVIESDDRSVAIKYLYDDPYKLDQGVVSTVPDAAQFPKGIIGTVETIRNEDTSFTVGFAQRQLNDALKAFGKSDALYFQFSDSHKPVFIRAYDAEPRVDDSCGIILCPVRSKHIKNY